MRWPAIRWSEGRIVLDTGGWRARRGPPRVSQFERAIELAPEDYDAHMELALSSIG